MKYPDPRANIHSADQMYTMLMNIIWKPRKRTARHGLDDPVLARQHRGKKWRLAGVIMRLTVASDVTHLIDCVPAFVVVVASRIFSFVTDMTKDVETVVLGFVLLGHRLFPYAIGGLN